MNPIFAFCCLWWKRLGVSLGFVGGGFGEGHGVVFCVLGKNSFEARC